MFVVFLGLAKDLQVFNKEPKPLGGVMIEHDITKERGIVSLENTLTLVGYEYSKLGVLLLNVTDGKSLQELRIEKANVKNVKPKVNMWNPAYVINVTTEEDGQDKLYQIDIVIFDNE